MALFTVFGKLIWDVLLVENQTLFPGKKVGYALKLEKIWKLISPLQFLSDLNLPVLLKKSREVELEQALTECKAFLNARSSSRISADNN